MKVIKKEDILLGFPFLKNTKLLLAVSGGIDSVVMTHLIKELNPSISIAHVNFQLRDVESDADEAFIKELGLKWQIQVFTQKESTQQFSEEKGISIQMAARELRYSWFDKLIQEHHFDYLLTAHHLDDSIETFFINLNRKSGLEGLTGIPFQNGKIIRPFLNYSREDIETYANENKLVWREDQSNATLKYERNQIRHLLLPILEHINPNFKTSFQVSQQYLKQSNVLIHDYIGLIQPNFWEVKDDEIHIDVKKLQSIPHFENVLYEVLKSYNFTDWTAIFDLIRAQSGKLVVSETHQILKDRNNLVLIKLNQIQEFMENESNTTSDDAKTEGSKFYDSVFKPQPKKVIVKKIKKTIYNKDIEKINIENSIDIGNMRYIITQMSNDENINFKKRGQEYFDADLIAFPLHIKRWQTGDFFFPLGMDGKKKLSDYFVDIKLSVLEKEKIWLLCDANDQIIWVIGYRIDNRFKVTSTTKNLLKIKPSE